MAGVIILKKYAQIQYSKVHWIFEAEEKPVFAPNIVLVDITGQEEIQEGWNYDRESNSFTPPEQDSIGPTEPQPAGPTIEDKVNYIYYKSMGVIA